MVHAAQGKIRRRLPGRLGLWGRLPIDAASRGSLAGGGLLSPVAQGQKQFALEYAYVPSRRDLFTDPDILAKFPHYEQLLEVAETTMPRPPGRSVRATLRHFAALPERRHYGPDVL
jgi:hypothetical protein